MPRSVLQPAAAAPPPGGAAAADLGRWAVSQGSLLRGSPGTPAGEAPGIPGDALSTRGVQGRRAVSASSLARRPYRSVGGGASAGASGGAGAGATSQHDKHGMQPA